MKAKTDKTVIVTTHDPLWPVKGGGALRTLAVIQELQKRFFKVAVIASCEDKAGKLKGVLYLTLPPPRKERSQILSAVKFNFRLLRRVWPLLGQADILFAHNTIACIWVPLLKRWFKRFKFVLDITDIHAEYLLIGKRSLAENLATPFLLWYEYAIIKSADRITVATQAMRKHLIGKGIDQNIIQVVYDSIDRQGVPQAKLEGADNNIIHLGAIDRQHNVELLIEAAPLVLKQFPQARFLLVGGGREKENISELARRLGVEDRCSFTGVLPCAQARELLKSASIGVITRKDVLPNRIITTLKIFEYWASQTAVIASPLEGIREIAVEGESILWFRSGDASDLAEKILFLLRNREYRNKLTAGGLRLTGRFDLRQAAEKIVDFSIRF